MTLANRTELRAAIGRARNVEFSAWLLRKDSDLVGALESAAEHGADVRVTLEREPWVANPAERKTLQRANRDTVRELRAHHVAARLTSKHGAPFHLKAAVIDGRAYLTDRNWAYDETIVTIGGRGVAAAVSSTIEDHRPHDTRGLALRKDRALALEAELIRNAPSGTPIKVETESLGISNVCDALRARAGSGERDLRLLYNAGASKRLDRAAAETVSELRAAGVEVRCSSANEKFCVAGDSAWIGSANATLGQGWTIDWGARSHRPEIANLLRSRFEQHWASAYPLA